MPSHSRQRRQLSRSKIDLFVECPRCFWLDVGQGVRRPSGPPFTLNNAVRRSSTAIAWPASRIR